MNAEFLAFVEATINAVGDMISKDEAITAIRREAASLVLGEARQPEQKTCRRCGGYGFVAGKRSIGDGWGEVDSCPDCTEVGEARQQEEPQEPKQSIWIWRCPKCGAVKPYTPNALAPAPPACDFDGFYLERIPRTIRPVRESPVSQPETK